MHLDIRLPLGFLFVVLGAILVGYGLISDDSMYAEHSLGHNVNLVWGAICAFSGGLVLLLVGRKQK